MKRILSFMLALSLVIGLLPVNSFAHDQDDSGKTYKLYPIPQSIEYDGKSYILKKKVNVVYDEEIDEATKQRLVEILELKDLEAVESDRFEENALNIFVGVYGSSGPASKFIEKEYEIDSVLFDNIDAYYLNNRDNIISILGRDTDSSFYGLTTLYHVFKQMDGLTIQNFEVQDYADIESRGYIEGYYGN